MVSMYAAQLALVAEIKDRLRTLTPDYYPQKRFLDREGVDRSLEDIEDELGEPRLFEIGEGIYSQATYIGCSTIGTRYTHTIKITYPNDEEWTIGMNSDAEKIRRDLITNSTSVSGVQQRHLDPEAEIIVQKDSDDPWQILILSLVVYYETTS